MHSTMHGVRARGTPMPNFYNVLDESGTQVFQYQADAPVNLNEFPLDKYSHVLFDMPKDPAPRLYSTRRITKLQWRRLMTPEEEMAFDKLRATFEIDPRFSDFQRDQIRTFANKYSEATEMDLDDPDQHKGLLLFVSLGILSSVDRVTEILNG